MAQITEYFIHDNGRRPVRIEIEGLTIRLYRSTGNSQYEPVPFYNNEVARIFVGTSPRNALTEFSGSYGTRFKGNSILIEETDHQCVYVGKETYRFRPLHEIVSFVAPVGNSDVPYTYARDAAGNVYLLIEDVILTSFPADEEENPYRWYYEQSVISNDMVTERSPPSVAHAIENIHHYHPADEPFDPKDQCRLSYEPNWRTPRVPERHIGGTIVYNDGTTTLMTSELVSALMQRIEARSGFRPLDRLLTLQPRLW